jgi:murein DD-endopeptidase MepM/ murein hydrolase activator NlpD
MKSLFYSVCFFLSYCAFAQDKPAIIQSFNFDDDDVSTFRKQNIEADSTHIEKLSDNTSPKDIKSDYWDTTVFNPYKDVELKFPLEIAFKDSSYTSPITRYKVVTSRYGYRKGKAHKGIDIDLVTGDSVVAMFDGIVRFASYNTGHGKTVIVRHYNGLETVYAHLSTYAVKVNDSIQRGDLLGSGGTTGNARGSHLHLVINYKGIAINPEYLFDFNEDNTIRSKAIWITQRWMRPGLHNSNKQSQLKLLLTEADALASLEKRTKTYVVKRGDTLSRISLSNNVSIASICKTNYIHENGVIKVGQKLIIAQ